MLQVDTAVLPLSLQTLHDIMSRAPAIYLSPINSAMSRFQIDTAKRVAAFLSQLAVESNELRRTHEAWSRRKNFALPGVRRQPHTAISQKDYFDYWYGNRESLGNTSPDDGYTYRGRGAIQITGKNNYFMIGVGIGKPLLDHPELIEADQSVDMLASAYFFARLKRLNAIADGVVANDERSVVATNSKLTRAVNGGDNALDRRLTYYKKALKVLKA